MANYSNYRLERGVDNSRNVGQYNNGYGYSGNGQGRQTGNAYSQGPRKRTSGCGMKSSYTRKQSGEVVNAPVVFGWMRAFGEFVKFVAVPNKDPKTKSDRWKKFVVTITPGFGQSYLTTGFWDTQKKRLSIPDLGLLADPNYANGGYTLKISKRK